MLKRPSTFLGQRAKQHLLWHRDKLLRLGTEQSARIDKEDATWIVALANTAAALLAEEKNKTVALYLPGQYFIGNRLSLPGVAVDQLESAIQLQLDNILPGQEQDLLAKTALQLEPEGQYQLVCFATSMANALHEAFSEQGLQLQFILPRTLLAIEKANSYRQVLDQDEQGQSLLQWQQGRVLRWAYINNADLSDPDFAQEWQDLQNQDEDCEHISVRQIADWQAYKPAHASALKYSFVPPTALDQRAAKKSRSKRIGLLSLLGILTFLVLLALVWFNRYETNIEKDLLKFKQATKEIRQLRDETFAIEERLAAIDHFPDQHIERLLLDLNKLIPKDSWLIQFNIKKGVLTLEGHSPNPTELLNKLAENPDFSQVAFHKPISSGVGGVDRFGISLTLKNVDVEGYVQTYYTQGE